jgi:hypothetical protein
MENMMGPKPDIVQFKKWKLVPFHYRALTEVGSVIPVHASAR